MGAGEPAGPRRVSVLLRERDQLAGETFGRRRTDGVAISLASGFHPIGDAVLLAAESVLALIHPIGGGLLDVGAALFYEVRAFAGLIFDDLAGLRPGLRRKQHSDANTTDDRESVV